MEQYTFIGFLITCVFGLSFFVKYLVSKVIKITETNTEAFKELKHAISLLEKTIENKIKA